MIDVDGYRPNVGIIISNQQGQLLWAKRIGQDAWQFPQGGIHKGENAEQAMYRELHEEVGLYPKDVEIIATTRGWLRYRLPKNLLRPRNRTAFIGQKQKWYLLRLVADEQQIDLQLSGTPEFDGWQWVSYWYPMSSVISFKRDVYRSALRELLRPLEKSLRAREREREREREMEQKP